MVVLEGFDKAIVGQTWTWENKERKDKFVYDGFVMVEILVQRDNMTVDEAHEYIEYTIENSAINNCPVIMWSIKDIQQAVLEDLKLLKEVKDGRKLH